MRHRVQGRKFGRNSAARKALFRNLLTQLFEHDRIVTTISKAKEVRSIAEKMITKAKQEDLHSRRQVLKVITNKKAVNRLFDIIVVKLSEKNKGGYTRILKLENRKGDDAQLVLLEIIEPGVKPLKQTTKKKTKAKAKNEKQTKKEEKIRQDSIKTMPEEPSAKEDINQKAGEDSENIISEPIEPDSTDTIDEAAKEKNPESET